MKPIIISLLILIIGLVGCNDYGASTADIQSQTFWSFNYTSYDSFGLVSASGTLNLVIDNSHVTGSWRFADGRAGNLTGTVENNKIQIDLYPGYTDHNLILTGSFSGNTFYGEWVMYGWAILGRGPFIAIVNLGVRGD